MVGAGLIIEGAHRRCCLNMGFGKIAGGRKLSSAFSNANIQQTEKLGRHANASQNLTLQV